MLISSSSAAANKSTIWRPFDLFEQNNNNNTEPTALIILNQPINEKNETYLKQLWLKSCVRLCADGAANRLYEWSSKNNFLNDYIPDYICGDLDSIKAEIKLFYKNSGSKIIRLHNQDLTDFYKTLKFTISCLSKSIYDSDLFETKELYEAQNLNKNLNLNLKNIYILCNFSGRFDHALANLNSLYKISNNYENNINIYIISEESLTFLLNKGENLVYVNSNGDKSKLCGMYCGYFPLNKASIVSTRGLKWDLNKQLCSFDDLISSSNEIELNDYNEAVYIETENPLLWTMGINKLE